MKADIAVLGSGGFGLALAIMLDNMGHRITVWSKFEQEIEDIRRDGENKAKLPGVKIPDSISFTAELSCVKDKDIVIFGIFFNCAVQNIASRSQNKIFITTKIYIIICHITIKRVTI